MVHQLTVNIESCRQILAVAILLCDDFSVWLIIFLNVLSVSNFLKTFKKRFNSAIFIGITRVNWQVGSSNKSNH